MKDLKTFAKEHKKEIMIGGGAIIGIAGFMIAKKMHVAGVVHCDTYAQFTGYGMKGNLLEKHYPDLYKKALAIGEEIYRNALPTDISSKGMVYIGPSETGGIIADII